MQIFSASQLRASIGSTIGKLSAVDLKHSWVWASIGLLQLGSLFSYDLSRVRDFEQILWLPVLISTIVFWFGYLLLAKSVSEMTKNRLVIVASGITTLVLFRAYFLELGLFPPHTNAVAGLIDRAPGDITINLAIVFSTSILGKAADLHLEKVNRLIAIQSQLREARANTKREATKAEADLREIAKKTLGDQLDGLRNQLRDSQRWEEVRAVAGQIRDLITDQVRPLSSRLRQSLEEDADTRELQKPPKPIRFRLPKDLNIERDLRPVATYFVAMPNILVTANALGGFSLMVIAGLASLLVPPLGWLMLLASKRLRLQGFIPNWIAVTLVLVASFLPVQFVIQTGLATNSSLKPLVTSAVGVYVLVGLLIAAWNAIEANRRLLEEEIESANHAMIRETAIIEQQVWIARKKWAYLIHGTVQGALTVAASRLQLADEKHPVDIQLIIKDLDRAADALEGNWGLDENFDSLLKGIIETWSGVLELEVAVSAPAKQLLESPITSRCLIEILKELVGNSYRHGQASRLVIDVATNSRGDLILNASNNGFAWSEGSSEGLGSKLFDDLTMSWQIQNSQDGVEFNAVLPGIYPRSESNQVLADW